MLEKYCIAPGISILDAMRGIDRSAIASVVVCEKGVVKGVLTDGDLRRAILRGASLADSIEPFYTRQFVAVGPDARRADVLDLMKARVLKQIPVVDDQGVLRAIHTVHNLLGNQERPNRALIMAGGKGTRLGAVTEKIPKPMLKVAGRPILERLVLHLVGHGIKQIYISVNHLSHVIEDHFGSGEEWGCAISYLREDQPLGSGGALSLIRDIPDQPLLMLNGDLVMEADLTEMLAFHGAHDFYATMGVHHYTHEVPYGCVEAQDGRMLSLEEKPMLQKLINGGVYVLSPAAIRDVPPRTHFPITELFESALQNGRVCGVYRLDGDWVDVGMPHQLNRARGEL